MKAHIIIIITTLFMSISAVAQTYTVEFEIKNIENNEGLISAALFSGEENFPKKEEALYSVSVDASEGTVTIRFENIPPGEYALAVFHDENSSGDMDNNLIGMPKEGYGFSNNARPRFGSPRYKDAKFRVQGNYYSTVYMTY